MAGVHASIGNNPCMKNPSPSTMSRLRAESNATAMKEIAPPTNENLWDIAMFLILVPP